MVMTPGPDGRLYYNDIRVIDYHAFIDSQFRIVEEIKTEDCERIVIWNEWEDLNDIEKYIARDRGLDIPSAKERRNNENNNDGHDAEIIPFPLGF